MVWADAGSISVSGLNGHRSIIRNSIFQSCLSAGRGGAVSGTNFEIIDCSFNGTIAQLSGGSVYLASGNATIVNSTFIETYGSQGGGAILAVARRSTLETRNHFHPSSLIVRISMTHDACLFRSSGWCRNIELHFHQVWLWRLGWRCLDNVFENPWSHGAEVSVFRVPFTWIWRSGSSGWLGILC